MKINAIFSILLVLFFTIGCSKQGDEASDPQGKYSTVSTDNAEEEEEEEEEPTEEEEVPLEEEVDEETMANPAAVYCEWTVTAVTGGAAGAVAKFKVGDVICYLCDDQGICSADKGPIVIGGRNFGDGFSTWGNTTDATCKVRAGCAGKYFRR